MLPHVHHFAISNLSKCQIWLAFPFVSKIASSSGSVKKVGVEELKQLAGDSWYLWLNVKPSSDLMRKTCTDIGFDSGIQICLQFCFCFLRIVMKIAAASGILLRSQQWIFFQFILQGSNLSFIMSSHVIGVLKLLRLGFGYYFLKGFSFVWLSLLLLLTFARLLLWLVLWCCTVTCLFRFMTTVYIDKTSGCTYNSIYHTKKKFKRKLFFSQKYFLRKLFCFLYLVEYCRLWKPQFISFSHALWCK